jgi:ribosome-associated protein
MVVEAKWRGNPPEPTRFLKRFVYWESMSRENDKAKDQTERTAQIPAALLPQSESTQGRVPAEQIARSMEIARAAVKAAAENRGQDIVLLDLTGQTALFDFFVIASGASQRQLGAMSTEIDRVLKHDFGEKRMSIAGVDEPRWIVLDYGSIVVHLFDEKTRAFYDLESLWADAKQVDVSEIVAAASAQMARLSK